MMEVRRPSATWFDLDPWKIDEGRGVGGDDGAFLVGPRGLRRDAEESAGTGFVVRDGAYVSARWPGDAWTFARAHAELLGS
jgi:hypothetical protein